MGESAGLRSTRRRGGAVRAAAGRAGGTGPAVR